MNKENLINECEKELEKDYKEIDNIEYKNSQKVLDAFHKYNLCTSDFYGTTGYGYGDIGRDKVEDIFSYVLGGEDSLVRESIISGTHALTITLFGLLRSGDTLLSITGTPYDTLHEVIGIKENDSSLVSNNINYEEIDLINNDFDYEKIKGVLTNKKIKVIEIQRSRGYCTRESINIEKIEKVISFIKNIDKNVIIMIDNCYTEFVEEKTPLEVGADIIVGSLIKNLGGGIASNGGYVCGKKELIKLVSERLTVPGCGKEIGPSSKTRELLLGLYFSPSVVASSLKVALLTSLVLEKLGYKVTPRYTEKRCDIVTAIEFNDEEKLISFCKSIQASSPIDSNALPEPSEMPGYDHKIIMASGSFTQGSSIELSCDGPIVAPFIAYMQGSVSYSYGKLALLNAINNL